MTNLKYRHCKEHYRKDYDLPYCRFCTQTWEVDGVVFFPKILYSMHYNSRYWLSWYGHISMCLYVENGKARGLHQSFPPKLSNQMKKICVCLFQRSKIMLPVVVCSAVSIILQNTNNFFSLLKKIWDISNPASLRTKCFLPSKCCTLSCHVWCLCYCSREARAGCVIISGKRWGAQLNLFLVEGALVPTWRPVTRLFVCFCCCQHLGRFVSLSVPKTTRWHCLIYPKKLDWFHSVLWYGLETMFDYNHISLPVLLPKWI